MGKNENYSLEFSKDKRNLLYSNYQNLFERYKELDKKIIQMIIINSAILFYLIEFIKIPFFTIYGVIFYFITFLIIVIILCLLLFNYIPKKYEIIDPDKILKNKLVKEESYVEFNEDISNKLIYIDKSMGSVLKNKIISIKISFLAIIIEYIFLAILIIIQQGGFK